MKVLPKTLRSLQTQNTDGSAVVLTLSTLNELSDKLIKISNFPFVLKF